jgi:hypothetical protein
VPETETAVLEDPTFDVAMTKLLEFYKAENADYTYRKTRSPRSKPEGVL